MATTPGKYEALVIGGSAGSIKVLKFILKSLPGAAPVPIIVGLHRLQTDTSTGLRDVIQFSTTMPVVEPTPGQAALPGQVYLAPANLHLVLEPDRTFSLSSSPLVQYSRPSIDVLFLSAADVYGPRLAALLVTGANKDGAFGLKSIKDGGGYIMVQDPADSFVDTMPRAALALCQADAVLPVSEMPDFLVQRLFSLCG
jgi:two-component system, chemotaxis family, protein-glutamate methylesterase/glutaminase